MTWMKVDDGFHASPKLQSIPARHRFQAAGLWVIAGSWSSQQMTDGFVPDYMIEAWKPTRLTVESLVNAGLWERVRGGFAFRSWLEYNPSKEQTEREREASKERMRASRERKKSERAGKAVANSDVAPQQAEPLQRNTPEPLQRPDPTRPDPTRPTSKEGRGESSRSVPRENATPPPSPDSSWLPSAIADVPPAWVQDPRSARCPKHTGVQDPPPCRGCGKAREVAEAARDERDAAEAQAAGERRALIDACDLCDPNGKTDGPRGLITCPHDPDALSAALAVEEAAVEDAAAQSEPVPAPAYRRWKHRHANRVETLGSETVLPAIDHNDHEPTHDAWDEDAS